MDKYLAERAFFVYRLVNDGERVYRSPAYFFQEHKVVLKDGKPVLLEGKPLTREAIINLCNQIAPTLSGKLICLGNNVIATSGMNLGPDIWWVPPMKRVMFFSKDMGIPSKKVPWPGLVLVSHKETLDVYAVKGDIKPTLKSRLYMAPLLNMQGGNSMCIGNSPAPHKSNDYSGWEKALFDSAFSGDGNDKRIRKGKLVDFLAKLPFKKAFPNEMLLPCKEPDTIGDLLDRLNNGE